MGDDATVPLMTQPAQARPTSFSRVSLAIMAHASEANLLGNVHGGEIMKLADSTAGAVAHRHSGGPAVTAAMDEMTFLAPVHVGDIIKTYSQVNWAGTSSMEIGVKVVAENIRTQVVRHANSCFFTMVAVGDDGKPVPVPPLRPFNAEEKRRWANAQARRELRTEMEQRLRAVRTQPPAPASAG